jgi:cation/acetate symporter
VAQYVILIAAYMTPVVWLSVKQTQVPLPQLVYGQQLQQVTAQEQRLSQDPKELEVQALYRERAQVLAMQLENPVQALAEERRSAQERINQLRAGDAKPADLAQADKRLSALPKSDVAAEALWREQKAQADTKSQPLNGMAPHAQQFLGDPDGTETERELFDVSRRNFMALVFCLMVGTAALPHILMRYYTVPSVREARESVAWSLLFIILLYITAPALAVMVKFEVFHVLVGTPFNELPPWLAAWNKVDPSLLSITDINLDGILQLNELTIGGDIVVLAMPEIAGLPYVISGLVAAGGLAAALSTADGLLLTIANALSHDLYYKMIDPNASTVRRVTISKVLLLVVALLAAYVAAQKPADILFLVAAAFSIAAAAFFPALVLGIFWRRATGLAATLGMVAGVGITLYYMATTQSWLREVFGVTAPLELWWGIQPIAAGVFGVPLGFVVMYLVSWVTPAPRRAEREWVEFVRYPNLRGPKNGQSS